MEGSCTFYIVYGRLEYSESNTAVENSSLQWEYSESNTAVENYSFFSLIQMYQKIL